MKDWLQKQIDSGFSDLKGLSISAHVPLQDQVLNELLSEALRGVASPATAPSPAKTPDLRSLVQFVKKAEVHAKDGALVIDVDIRV